MIKRKFFKFETSFKKGLTTLIGNYHPDIVVVSENKTVASNTEDNDLNKLKYVPLFYPILKESINLKEDQPLYQISPEHVFKLSEILKNHLNTCAYNVTKDQEAITIEIRNLHLVIDTLIQSFSDKQKKYAKYCDQFKVVQDLSHNLKKVQRSMDEILPMMKEINEYLPENERLEEFKF